MTPNRKAALQWFHDRGEVDARFQYDNGPTNWMIRKLKRDGLVSEQNNQHPLFPCVIIKFYSLTDKGRRDLHEASQ